MEAITKCYPSFQAAPATPAPSNATRPATLTISAAPSHLLARVIPHPKAIGMRHAVEKPDTR